MKLQRLRCTCLAPIVAFRASAPGVGSQIGPKMGMGPGVKLYSLGAGSQIGPKIGMGPGLKLYSLA